MIDKYRIINYNILWEGVSAKGQLRENSKANITLSTDNQILKELKKDAKLQGVSLNVKVNSLFTKYVLLYRHVEEQGGVIMPKEFIAWIVNFLPENKLAEMLDMSGGFEVVPSIFVQNNIPPTIENLIKYYFEGIALWAGPYNKFRYYTDRQGYLCLIFEHNFGMKWSRALGIAFSHLITSMTNLTADLKPTPTTILIRVDTKSS